MDDLQDGVVSSVNGTGTCATIDTPVTQRRSADVLRQALFDAPEHIYFVYSAGLVKIGYSTNWLARTEQVCAGCPHHAEVILVMPGGRSLERDYHRLFADSSEGGEWFRLEGNVRRFLDHFASPEGRENLALADDDYRDLSRN